MLKVDNLTIWTHKGRRLVEGLSFVLNDGDKLALIGEEGNGKSTIMKIIAGIDVSDYVSFEGNIIGSGHMGYLPQRIESWHLDDDVINYIVDGQEMDYARLYDAIKRVNIDSRIIDEDRIIKSLSGGEKVKVSLARVLYGLPDALLLDEPTNDLDLETLIWLEEFIKSEKRPIMFISHDETMLENCSNAIIHLEQLKRKSEPRVTYSGEGYREYCQNRQYNISRINMIAKKEKAELNKQLERYRQIYQRVEHEQNTISRGDPHGGQLLKKKMHAVKSLGRNLEEKERNLTQKYEPEEAIDIFFEDVKMNGDKDILDLHLDELKVENRVLSKDIDIHVKGKDKVCIIGRNGIGKTTLFRKIYEVLSARDDISLGYMPQNYHEVMDYDMTPVEFLLMDHEYSMRSKVQSFLGALKLTSEEMEHRIAELSEGQKCKILIIRMILDGNDVLLMDEPTRNLSPLSGPRIREILNDYKGTIISVSHDRKYIDEVCDKVYELSENGLKEMS